jgi:glutathione S-transferase
MPDVLLHQWVISPFCRKVRKVLAHKGVAYRTVEYNGLRARAAAGLSAAGKLPVLDYDGERIQDSSAIFDFLEAKHPAPALVPSDPDARALALTLEDWADESLYFLELYLRFEVPEARAKGIDLLCAGRPSWERAIFAAAVMPRMRRKVRWQGIGKLSRERVEQLFADHLARVDDLLARSGWLVGSDCTIADIAVGSQFEEIRRTSHLAPRLDDRPRVVDWLARLPQG